MVGAGQRKLGRKAFRADEYVIRALLLILMSKQDDSFQHTRGSELEEIVEESTDEHEFMKEGKFASHMLQHLEFRC